MARLAPFSPKINQDWSRVGINYNLILETGFIYLNDMVG
jgi:hypothetical protein